ncbi:MAG: hypothetical protein WDO24_31095 [Pseudomonadota bacterium]
MLRAAAGLPLDARQIAQLCECAPYIDAMSRRIARDHPVEREPRQRGRSRVARRTEDGQ